MEIEKQEELVSAMRDEKAAWIQQMTENDTEYSKTIESISLQNDSTIAKKTAEAARVRYFSNLVPIRRDTSGS